MGERDAEFAHAAGAATMVPLLPCGDVDELLRFWTALGLVRTYRQLRPNPYVSLRAGRIELHYYGMPAWVPGDSHSTCIVAVPDPRPIHERFRAGLQELYGGVPVSGIPRITRPRERANNGGLSGFTVIDPAGNWVRITRAPQHGVVEDEVATTTWTSTSTTPLGRALENAVVIGDSHGDHTQALKVIMGALRRATDASTADRAAALAYVVELQLRLGDTSAAARTLEELEEFEPDDDPRVAAALSEARDTVATSIGPSSRRP